MMAKLTSVIGALATLLCVMDFNSGVLIEQIPAAFGVAMFTIGFFVAARNQKRRESSMRTAALLAFLGFLSTLWWVVQYVQMILGRPFPRPAAVVEHTLACLVYLFYVLLYVRVRLASRRQSSV